MLALLIHAQATLGQSDAVPLQLKLTPGEAFFHSATGNVQVNFENSAGDRRSTESRFEIREAIRVLDVAALGAIWIEATAEEYRVTERGGQPRERLIPAVSFRVDPDGKVVERFADPTERPDFPFPLPGKPVRVGESWTRSATSTSGEIVVKGNGTYTLSGLGSGPDGRIARVTFINEGRASGGATVLGLPTESRASSKVTGEFEWLIDRGRWGRYVQEFTATGDTQVTAPGIFGLARLTSKASIRGDPLSASVSPALPGPDLIVTPGQGVGPYGLTMTVEDLNRHAGASEFREFDLGFLSHSLRWRNGLVAYVAQDDNNKVVGLEISDRSYRSSKGVGVTMSQGAVMLAHGLTPVRVEMSIPGRGHYRLLVYNDQGIAFSIVSEENIRTRTITSIPVGLVAWVTVFPPGGGGRIFPLPGQR
ncbi:MAG: hypothetical protein ACRDIC_02640 [bacterium]